MGTRNLIMVIANGKTKVAQYGQWDGYLSGQGLTVLRTMKKIVDTGELELFKKKVLALKWLTKKKEKEIEADNQWDIHYPYLSRDCAAEILNAIHYNRLEMSRKEVTINGIVGLVNKEDFAADSLFCEWAYVIDLNKNVLEVYQGFNKTPLTIEDRFYHLQDLNEEYQPIKIIGSFPLNLLPDESIFLGLEQKEDEEEEVNPL